MLEVTDPKETAAEEAAADVGMVAENAPSSSMLTENSRQENAIPATE